MPKRKPSPDKTKRKRSKRNRCLDPGPITKEEIDANQSVNHCYCITRLDGKMAYIGSTPDKKRRLRQHRREIQGGAKRTAKMKGDAHYFVTLKGFLCHRDAQQCEWAWDSGKRLRPSKLVPSTTRLQPVIVEHEAEEEEEEGKEEKKLPPHPIRTAPRPLKKLLLRLFALLLSEKWTKQAIPTNDPWRTGHEIEVQWHVDPRQYGIYPENYQVALPVRHMMPKKC